MSSRPQGEICAFCKRFFTFISLRAPKKRTKEKAPSSLAYGPPRENHKHGVVTNSYPPAGLKHVTPCFRVYELRSAALQRVLKSESKNEINNVKKMIGVFWFPLVLQPRRVHESGHRTRSCLSPTRASSYRSR